MRLLLRVRGSASISKGQYPGITKELVIDYIYKEVKRKFHTTLTRNGEYVNFNNAFFDIAPYRFPYKWKNYSFGEFKIFEKEEFIIVSFIGNIRRGVVYASIIPVGLTIMSLYFVIKEGAYFLPLLVLLTTSIFPLLVVIMEKMGLPLYMTRMISRLKERKRDETSTNKS